VSNGTFQQSSRADNMASLPKLILWEKAELVADAGIGKEAEEGW